ncbi:hypothetical protein [Sandaracinus amylolyticus]|uniref:hypothetical protein n=1 Tax=Sandaracinus amylolyticus TaxID=927083 RepID=UPI001F2C690E|nr:hypothetical protein [Sandaracinus amylolyticus]UJR83919.1 Hypothetical protein I5071_59900 [Sandaracinus amylolyticus]
MPGDGEETRVARIAPESPNQLAVRDTVNVLVLIGGTTEPGNLGGGHRSAGYSRPGVERGDPSYWSRPEDELRRDGLTDSERWYWQDNPGLRAAIMSLHDSYTNLHVFTAHGWSGDNSPYNREVAGKYIADRLCGAEGERPYYAGFLSREVHFHLLGHSHGGNVINELCREAARVWPSRWKIRTVVYLSTPFFQRLHQVDTGAFDPDCKIISATDEFDLTQRVLADFNLLQLNKVLELTGFAAVGRAVSAAASSCTTSFAGLDADLLPMLSSVHVVDTDTGWGVSPEIRFDPTRSARVYGHLLGIFTPIREVLRQVRVVIDQLQQGIEYPASIEFVGRVSQGRSLISESLRRRWDHFINELDGSIATTESALEARRASGVFEISGVLTDFESPAFMTVSRDLRVGVGGGGVPVPGSLTSPFTDLLVATLLEQIDVYDDTRTSPDRQLAGTPFASNIVELDITPHDSYPARTPFSSRARDFFERVTAIEARYQSRRAPDDLVDLLLTMLAQHGPVREMVEEWWPLLDELRRGIDWIYANLPPFFSPGGPGFGATTNLLSVLRSIVNLVDVAWFWCTHLRERDVGGIAVDPPEKSPWRNRASDPYMGELAYLALVCHSQSRFDLYPEIKEELESQLTTRRRRAAASSR